MVFQNTFEIATDGRGTVEITAEVQALVARSAIKVGTCHLFIQHTSASLIVCENAAESVRRDLERFAARFAPDGDPDYAHDAEGPDDMSAHIRSVFTHTDLTLPVGEGRLLLGTWQGIYLWEHRVRGHRRRIVVTMSGE
jgi:secondary thiamine-phosphate synthase enzyme